MTRRKPPAAAAQQGPSAASTSLPHTIRLGLLHITDSGTGFKAPAAGPSAAIALPPATLHVPCISSFAQQKTGTVADSDAEQADDEEYETAEEEDWDRRNDQTYLFSRIFGVDILDAILDRVDYEEQLEREWEDAEAGRPDPANLPEDTAWMFMSDDEEGILADSDARRRSTWAVGLSPPSRSGSVTDPLATYLVQDGRILPRLASRKTDAADNR